jgi:hypothetical protein
MVCRALSEVERRDADVGTFRSTNIWRTPSPRNLLLSAKVETAAPRTAWLQEFPDSSIRVFRGRNAVSSLESGGRNLQEYSCERERKFSVDTAPAPLLVARVGA